MTVIVGFMERIIWGSIQMDQRYAYIQGSRLMSNTLRGFRSGPMSGKYRTIADFPERL